MRIRLHGTPEEISAIVEILTDALDVRDISHPYPDRPPSRLHRVYLDAAPQPRKAGDR